MNLINKLLQQTEKIDFNFPNSFDELMNNDYYDYDKFEWFLYYVFKLDGNKVEKVGKKGKGDGGADLIITMENNGKYSRIGIQAKYWKYKVGTEPINQLASAKARHSLDELMIITTSDLTSDAKEIAESMKIKILRAEDVKSFIEIIKEKHNQELTSRGESSISFLTPKVVEVKKTEVAKENNKSQTEDLKQMDPELVDKLKKIRILLSEKHKLTPLYNVFNNETLEDIIDQKPQSLDQLLKIKGLGPKKIEIFGNDLLEHIKPLFVKKSATEMSDTDKELLDILLKERIKISKFNKIPLEKVFSDKVATYLVKMKPTSKEALAKIYDFDIKNIDIFGEYLVKVIESNIKKN